jgi:hypothetical protein
MKTAPNNKKVREIITLVKEGKLIPRPEFQRRLVWSREDKNNFIDTILRGYPFPEIYFADGDVDLNTGEGTQLLVDGLQRVNTIVQYFSGDKELKLTTVPAYNDLEKDAKQAFLQYDVAVRDLGAVSKEETIEVFKRLNATKYSLTDIEVSNAIYAGALKKFAESFSEDSFFQRHSIFNAADYKRMGDLRYCLTIVSTLMGGYFNRDDVFEDLLDRYNDDFPQKTEMLQRLQNVLAFIDECGFDEKSRIWRKADLYTLIVELDNAINLKSLKLQPSDVIKSIQDFLAGIDAKLVESSLAHAVYYKAALQATNDKINRIRRGTIIGSLLEGKAIAEIEAVLQSDGLA